MKKFLMLCVACVVCLTASSCLFDSQPNSTFYNFIPYADLSGIAELKRPIEVKAVQMTPETRINLTMPDGTVTFDIEKRWEDAPGILMQKYLTGTLASAQPEKPSPEYLAAKPYIIRISVYSFTYNMKKRVAEVGLTYTISDPNELDATRLPKVISRRSVYLASRPQAEDEINPGLAVSQALQQFVMTNLSSFMDRKTASSNTLSK